MSTKKNRCTSTACRNKRSPPRIPTPSRPHNYSIFHPVQRDHCRLVLWKRVLINVAEEIRIAISTRRAKSRSAATAPSIAQTTLASPGLTPLNCHVKPRYFIRCPARSPVRAFSRPRRFATSLVPPASYHNSSTTSCPRYESAASRHVATRR